MLGVSSAACTRLPPSACMLANLRLPAWSSVHLWLLRRLPFGSVCGSALLPTPDPVWNLSAPVRRGAVLDARLGLVRFPIIFFLHCLLASLIRRIWERPAHLEAWRGCKCTSCREDGPAAGPKLHARPSAGTGCLGRNGRQTRRARTGAEVTACIAMSRHIVLETPRIASSMKIFLETVPVEAANSVSSVDKRKGCGDSSGVRSMVQGDNAARACASSAVLVPLHRVFGFSIRLSPRAAATTAEDANVCVRDMSTTTGRPGRYMKRAPRRGLRWERGGGRAAPGGAAGVGGGGSIGGCGGIGCGGCGYIGRCGGCCQAGSSDGSGLGASGCCGGCSGSGSFGGSGCGHGRGGGGVGAAGTDRARAPRCVLICSRPTLWCYPFSALCVHRDCRKNGVTRRRLQRPSTATESCNPTEERTATVNPDNHQLESLTGQALDSTAKVKKNRSDITPARQPCMHTSNAPRPGTTQTLLTTQTLHAVCVLPRSFHECLRRCGQHSTGVPATRQTLCTHRLSFLELADLSFFVRLLRSRHQPCANATAD